MIKFFIRVFMLPAFFLTAAVFSVFCGDGAKDESLEALFDGGYFVTRPSGSVITVFGAAGRRRNRDEGLRLALLDAARKAALYHGLHGESAAVLSQGSGILDYFSDFDYRLELRRNPEDFLDALIFDRAAYVLEKNGVVLARVRYAGVSDIPPYSSVLENGIPDWTKKYVVTIPGYMTGIGYSKNKGSFQKTCEASYENALVSLLSQLSTRVDSESVDAAGGRVSHNVARSEGDLTGVMILETWFDRKVNAVWTLVAAKAQD
jgi:hypothetical protein